MHLFWIPWYELTYNWTQFSRTIGGQYDYYANIYIYIYGVGVGECHILQRVRAKIVEATLLFVDFSQPFDCLYRGNMEQILLVYGLTKETVAAIMKLSKNTKVKVRSPDGNTHFFDIVAAVLQGDILAPYLFIICLDYVIWTAINLMKENSFILKKARNRWYFAHTMTDADDADDIGLLVNTAAQAEFLLHTLEKAAGGIGLYLNADKTENICFIKIKEDHCYTKRWCPETSRQMYLSRKLRLIYG